MISLSVLYDVGSPVWVVSKRSQVLPRECAACGSTGKVTLAGEEYVCPACNGGTQLTGKEEPFAEPGVVERAIAMRCSLTASACPVRYLVRRASGKVSVYFESAVFPTEQAAQAALPVST